MMEKRLRSWLWLLVAVSLGTLSARARAGRVPELCLLRRFCHRRLVRDLGRLVANAALPGQVNPSGPLLPERVE